MVHNGVQYNTFIFIAHGHVRHQSSLIDFERSERDEANYSATFEEVYHGAHISSPVCGRWSTPQHGLRLDRWCRST